MRISDWSSDVCSSDLLDEGLDTGPFVDWFNAGNVQQLNQVRRTNQAGLLDGALALRGGGFPQPGAGLLLGYRFPAQMPFAIGHAINRDRQGTAVIVAHGSGPWASPVIQRLTEIGRAPCRARECEDVYISGV